MKSNLTVKLAYFCLLCSLCFSEFCVAKRSNLNEFSKVSETIVDSYGNEDDSKNSFFSLISRMRYIDRWSLFNNSEEENLESHSFEVAVVAHALATIKNKKFGGNVDANKAAVLGLFHDVLEVITGDAPTPTKYFDPEMKKMYTKLEEKVSGEILDKIEDQDVRTVYAKIISPRSETKTITEGDKELARIVKSADNISALIKCLREKRNGNNDFDKVYERLYSKIKNDENEEVKYFMENYLKSYGCSDT